MSDLQESVEQGFSGVRFGRLYCGECRKYDHECGCDPSITDKMRRKAVQGLVDALEEDDTVAEAIISVLGIKMFGFDSHDWPEGWEGITPEVRCAACGVAVGDFEAGKTCPGGRDE